MTDMGVTDERPVATGSEVSQAPSQSTQPQLTLPSFHKEEEGGLKSVEIANIWENPDGGQAWVSGRGSKLLVQNGR